MATWIIKGYCQDGKGRRRDFMFDSDTPEQDRNKEVAESLYAARPGSVQLTYINTKKPEQPNPFENIASNISMGNGSSNSDDDGDDGNAALGLFALLALIAGGYIVWFSAPVIAFVGSGGLAFKTVKNRTGGMQWAKRTGAFLLATGLASMASFHGTIATQESIATWWNENITEEVSSN